MCERAGSAGVAEFPVRNALPASARLKRLGPRFKLNLGHGIPRRRVPEAGARV